MTNLIYSQVIPNEQKIRFQGIAHDFFCLRLEFSKFLMKFEFVFETLLNFVSRIA